jgi:hypothetical protein
MTGDDDLDTLPGNPAARLLGLIMDAGAGPEDSQIKQVWARVLHAEDDDSLLLRRLGIVYGLPQAIRDQVATLPNENHQLLLKQIPKIEGALQRNIYEQWSNIRQQIDEALIHSLEMISFLLDREKTEPSVDKEALADLHERVVEFYETLADDRILDNLKLDPDLRMFLLRQLERMRTAIQEVRWRGASALQEAGEAVVGAIVIRGIQNPPKSEDDKSLLRTVGSLASTALTIVSLFTAPFTLAIAAQDAIGPGEKEPATVTVTIDADEVGDVVVVEPDSGTVESPDTR